MGEIGRDRREFLYEMSFCDILLITRGYRRRNVLMYQLQRLTAYGTFFAMSGSKADKEPHEWLPLYFDRYTDISGREPITEEARNQLLMEMEALNKELSKQ